MFLITSIVASTIALSGATDHGEWNYSITSSGANEVWTAPSGMNITGQHYEMRYTITAASVFVSYLGFEFGPYDVMDMIPPDVIETFRTQPGPCGFEYGWIEVITPPDQDPPSLAYDWMVSLDDNGIPSFRMENLSLGVSEYDLGWPWGSVIVQIESGTVAANLKIDIVDNPCYEDADSTGTVDVADLLMVIDNWGECPGCIGGIPGDVNYDTIVDVTDLLQIVSAWGPCPG